MLFRSISQPLTVLSLMSQVHGQFNVCRYASTVRFLISHVLCTMSLLSSAAINVDRLFALFLRLRYRQFVTLKRMYVIVTAFWVLSIAVLNRRKDNMVFYYSPVIVSYYIRYLLCKNISYAAPQPNPSKQPCCLSNAAKSS